MKKLNFYLDYLIETRRSEIFPLQWEQLFGRSAPLAVEIGFGNGEYLENWTQQQPDWNIVGIELAMESTVRLLRRLKQKQRANGRVLHGDARFMLRECFAENSLHKVMMQFPDPWPKDRHKDRRLIDQSFIKTLSMVLKPNATYELVTDQDWYATDAFELFNHSGYFSVAPIEINPERRQTTRYERKWQAMSRTTHRLVATKTRSAVVNRLLEDIQMPHAFVEKPLKLEHFVGLIGSEERTADTLCVVKGAYHEADRNRYLLKVVAADGAYSQSFFVQVKPHEEHPGHKGRRWIVKLDATMPPHRTPAVKKAIRSISAMLDNICQGD